MGRERLRSEGSLSEDFHNMHIELRGVSPKFLYARFVSTISPLLSTVLNTHIPRELLVRLPNGQEIARSYKFDEIKADFPSKSRSASPRKRQITIPEETQLSAKRACLQRDARHSWYIAA